MISLEYDVKVSKERLIQKMMERKATFFWYFDLHMTPHIILMID